MNILDVQEDFVRIGMGADRWTWRIRKCVLDTIAETDYKRIGQIYSHPMGVNVTAEINLRFIPLMHDQRNELTYRMETPSWTLVFTGREFDLLIGRYKCHLMTLKNAPTEEERSECERWNAWQDAVEDGRTPV